MKAKSIDAFDFLIIAFLNVGYYLSKARKNEARDGACDPEFYTLTPDFIRAHHDPKGAANTLRGYQIKRPSIYDFETDIGKIALPTLIVCGDEDDPCVEPSIFLKRHIAASGLAMFPKSGHTVNIEEPALFNQTVADFLALVDAGRWGARDNRSIRAGKK